MSHRRYWNTRENWADQMACWCDSSSMDRHSMAVPGHSRTYPGISQSMRENRRLSLNDLFVDRKDAKLTDTAQNIHKIVTNLSMLFWNQQFTDTLHSTNCNTLRTSVHWLTRRCDAAVIYMPNRNSANAFPSPRWFRVNAFISANWTDFNAHCVHQFNWKFSNCSEMR